jgi:PAS domain S-box-containing protein
MESALRESEQRFRSAFESAAIGMALVAPDGRWLRVNQALCRIVGYSAEELLKIDFQTITHPDDLDTDLAFARQMLDGTRSYYEMEKRYFHKTGRTIWILLSVSLVRDDEGRPRYFISQIQDISARKATEERLRESELRYRITSDLVPGFLFEGAVVGGVPQPTWVSDGFERVYGCSLEGFQRLGPRHFYDAETRAQLRAGAALVARGEDLRMDVRLRSADGTPKWLRVSARAWPANGGGARVLGVAEDITEQNRLEQALREATQQEQQRLGREIHDGLGQELSGLAYLSGSLAKAAAGADPGHANDLATLERIANRCIETCRNIARGVSPLTESRGSLVQALRHLTEGAAPGGPTRLDFEAIENAPLTLPWAHRDQLYRIAQEAVTNALRHSAGDRIRVTIAVDATLVRIEIADNGRGFDPRRSASEGLGLDSMRQRAAAIGARLRLRSAATGGAAVVCECPQSPAAPDPGPARR